MDELTEAESTVTSNYVIGESVKVINGPFNGFNGTIWRNQRREEKNQSYG